MEQERKQYVSSNVLFSTTQKEYEYELERGAKLDSKISITLSFCGLMFLIFFDSMNYRAVIEGLSSYPNVGILLLAIACLLMQILAIILFVYVVYKLVSLLGTRQYHHINNEKYILEEELHTCKVDQAEYYMALQYLAMTAANHETNEKRTEEYGKCIPLLLVVLLFLFTFKLLFVNFL